MTPESIKPIDTLKKKIKLEPFLVLLNSYSGYPFIFTTDVNPVRLVKVSSFELDGTKRF